MAMADGQTKRSQPGEAVTTTRRPTDHHQHIETPTNRPDILLAGSNTAQKSI